MLAWAMAALTLAALPAPAALALAAPVTTAFGFSGGSGLVGQAGTLDAQVLEIVSAAATHIFEIELADEPAQRQKGLMYRRQLAGNAGMLFDFKAEQPISMWMKNTYIPLDMLFISQSGEVLHIAEHTVPFSLDRIDSGAPARFVLEVAAGTAGRLGIKPGDTVRHRLMAPR